MKPIFYEEQKFNQWWLWLILIVTTVISIFPMVGIMLEDGFEKVRGIEKFLMITSVGLFIGILISFKFIKLKTKITSSIIEYSFAPLITKKISWNQVQKAEVIDYGFIGGWGIRWPTKYGVVYNVRGSKGLYLTLKNGKKRLIGTQKEEALKKALNQLKER